MDIVDAATKLLAAVGAPTLIAVWGRKSYTYWKNRHRRKAEQDKNTQTIPLEVRGVAATTFESEIAVLQRSFAQDRAIKDNTIRDLLTENRALQAKKDAAERRADVLEKEVDDLKRRLRETLTQVQELVDTVELMSEKLSQSRIENQELSDEDFRLHPGPGS